MNHLEACREFATLFDCPRPDAPCQPGLLPPSAAESLRWAADACWRSAEAGSVAAKFLGHVVEELAELFEAYSKGDRPATLDAFVDAEYCLLSAVLALGYGSDAPGGLGGAGFRRFDRAFCRVHRANLAKAAGPDGPRKNAAGKVLKPEGWRAPELADLCAVEAGPC